jgi:hypothetical protein
MPYVHALTRVLDRHLGWNRARLKFMARFILGALRLTTCNLHRLALALKDGVKPASSYRRIQRFLAGYDVDFVALGRLLVHRAGDERLLRWLRLLDNPLSVLSCI